jgi:non-homologous end joining protein Ku
MDLRTLWKGAVSFGLVNIPVKMYVATEKKILNLITCIKNACPRLSIANTALTVIGS